MKLWFKSILVFIGTLILTLIIRDLNFKYNFFKIAWEFNYYKWAIPCFVVAFYLTANIGSNIRAIIGSLMSISVLYSLELAYQYNFSPIAIDYAAPTTLWQMKKDKLMIYLNFELSPWPWLLAGLSGCLCSIIYKIYQNKKKQERNIHV